MIANVRERRDELDRVQLREIGLEISLTKREVVLSLDDLDEDRPNDIFRKNLQQITFLITIDENIMFGDFFMIFLHVRHASEDIVVISFFNVERFNSTALHHVERLHDITRRKGNVLDSRTVVFAQVLIDL